MKTSSRTILRLTARAVAGSLFVLSLSAGSAFAAKNYYKWVDENGVTHYSERKPHNQEAERISVATGRSTESEAAASGTSAAAANSSATSNAEKPAGESGTTVASNSAADTKDPERCEQARQNLRVLQENARVRLKTEDGSFRYLDENEKAAKTQEAQDAINEAC